jgi:hypothetical protein
MMAKSLFISGLQRAGCRFLRENPKKIPAGTFFGKNAPPLQVPESRAFSPWEQAAFAWAGF